MRRSVAAIFRLSPPPMHKAARRAANSSSSSRRRRSTQRRRTRKTSTPCFAARSKAPRSRMRSPPSPKPPVARAAISISAHSVSRKPEMTRPPKNRNSIGGGDGADVGRQAAFRLGLSAESRAAALLLAKGYRVVARRYRTHVGEVDIVARRGNVLVFVEVKARDRLDDAAEAVTERQQRRIIAAAEAWLAA